MDGSGFLGVRFEKKGDDIYVKLTGDYFLHDESVMAHSTSRIKTKEVFTKSESPIYLVRTSIVDTTINMMYDRKNLIGYSKCHEGSDMRPCGKRNCHECIEGRMKLFTHTLSCNLELPDSDLTLRIVSALQNVIGIPKMYFSDYPVSEKEIQNIFNVIGVKPRKDDDESY